MNKKIKGYRQETEFVNAGAGTATWCIASKDGRKYFIKSFLEATLIDEETAKKLPAPMVEAKRKSCVEFRARKQRLYDKLNEIRNGIFISPIELFVHNGHYCAVTDYLESFSDSDSISHFQPRRKAVLMRTMVLAMRDLAANHIVHSDIKPDNIVITFNQRMMPQLKIIDFDSGFFEDAPPRNVNEYHGDMVYFAPESMIFMQSEGESDVPLTCAVDKFAVGLLLHTMWCGSLPTYDKAECANVAEAILLRKPVVMDKSIPGKLAEVIAGFLQMEADDRISYDQAYALLGELMSTLPEDQPESQPEENPEPESEHIYKAKQNDVSAKETKITVSCFDTNGNVLDRRLIAIAYGTKTFIAAKNLHGYTPVKSGCDVVVDAAGNAEPKTVDLIYKKKKNPWPVLVVCILAILLGLLLAAVNRSNAEQPTVVRDLVAYELPYDQDSVETSWWSAPGYE